MLEYIYIYIYERVTYCWRNIGTHICCVLVAQEVMLVLRVALLCSSDLPVWCRC
jgi:hypothetical protein